MYVKIFKLGEEKEVTIFPTGIHILGRGATLQCSDKRVSRNHASLEVAEDTVKLTSTHINPCFLKAANSKTITILAKDSISELKDGDSFALLPEDFWFRVKLVKDEVPNEIDTKQDLDCKETNKRPCSLDEEPPDKKLKIEIGNEERNVTETPSTAAEGSRGPVLITELDSSLISGLTNEDVTKKDNEYLTTDLSKEAKEDTVEPTDKDCGGSGVNNIKSIDVLSAKEKIDKTGNQGNASPVPDNGCPSNEETKKKEDNEGPSNEDMKSKEDNGGPSNEKTTSKEDNEGPSNEEKKSKEDNGGPSNEEAKAKDDTSVDGGSGVNPNPPQLKVRREKCWYEAQCYRQNPVHRQIYRHPGDSDFESDSDDNRPTCSYGAQCYRKNTSHRQQYKHPPREPPGKKKRSRKKVDRLNAAESQELRDLDEEFSDFEDPFLDDDSDEYNEESDDGDSDFDDSQEADEDSGNVKRLLKEAKRFAKQ